MDNIQLIKEKLDIVDVVSGYVKLEKAGINWRARCPFHKEKTPSFFVSRERQSWHCFGGCGEGGDMFKFVMKMENIDFKEALKILAGRAGVELRYESKELKSEKDNIYAVCEEAAKFFENELGRLGKEENSPLAYLNGRGLKDETIKEFRLGYAPPLWRNLSQFLRQKGFKDNEIIKSGLVIRTEKGDYYNRFRGRIMFPLFDSYGKVVGFTGRVFPETQMGVDNKQINADNISVNQRTHQRESAFASAKYVNTPETPIFNKGKLLYGLHKTKDFIRKNDAALLVEGQMDLLMAYQDGVKNVVATGGTALTSMDDSNKVDHLKLISRFTKNLILGFDMDEAGQKAAERSIGLADHPTVTVSVGKGRETELILLGEGFDIKVFRLPQGKDVADFVKENPTHLKEIVEKSIPIMDYYFERATEKTNGNFDGIEDKIAVVDYLLPKIAKLVNPVLRGHWISMLADKIKIKENYLEEKLKDERLKILRSKEKMSFQEKSYSPVNRLVNETSRKDVLAERLMGLLIKKPHHYEIISSHIDYFPAQYKIILDSLKNGKIDISDDNLNYLAMKIDYEIPDIENLNFETELAKLSRDLKREIIKEQIDAKCLEIKEAEKNSNLVKLEKLLGEIKELSKELN